jgi:hypothetical protein
MRADSVPASLREHDHEISVVQLGERHAGGLQLRDVLSVRGAVHAGDVGEATRRALTRRSPPVGEPSGSTARVDHQVCGHSRAIDDDTGYAAALGDDAIRVSGAE